MEALWEDKISKFYYQEAYLLDHRQYREWLDLLTDDFTYVMPLRVTVDNKAETNLVEEMTYFKDTKNDVRVKVERLYTKTAWVENPAPRQRHFISNVVVESTDVQDEYKVRSYFLFKRSRNTEANTEEIFGEREDIIRRTNDGWKIASRKVYADQAVLTVMNLSMFL